MAFSGIQTEVLSQEKMEDHKLMMYHSCENLKTCKKLFYQLPLQVQLNIKWFGNHK
jgi:hypothetical protein